MWLCRALRVSIRVLPWGREEVTSCRTQCPLPVTVLMLAIVPGLTLMGTGVYSVGSLTLLFPNIPPAILGLRPVGPQGLGKAGWVLSYQRIRLQRPGGWWRRDLSAGVLRRSVQAGPRPQQSWIHSGPWAGLPWVLAYPAPCPVGTPRVTVRFLGKLLCRGM